MKFNIIGSGTWGITFANLLAKNNNSVIPTWPVVNKIFFGLIFLYFFFMVLTKYEKFSNAIVGKFSNNLLKILFSRLFPIF